MQIIKSDRIVDIAAWAAKHGREMHATRRGWFEFRPKRITNDTAVYTKTTKLQPLGRDVIGAA